MAKSIQFGNTRLEFHKGYAIQQPAQVIINSANNGLLFGGSGALKIKDVTGPGVANDVCLDSELVQKFQEIYARLKPMGDKLGLWIGEVCKEWIKGDYKTDESGKRKSQVKETYVQLECLEHIEARGGRPCELGDAVITTSGKIFSPSMPTPIIHAVGMGYTWDKVESDEKGKTKFRKGERIPSNPSSIRKSLEYALEIIGNRAGRGDASYHSLALPLMCVRDGYSEKQGKEMTEEEKKEAIRNTCKEYDEITLDVIARNAERMDLYKILYCADNENSVEYFKDKGRL